MAASLSTRWIAQALNIPPLSPCDTPISEIVTDSRKISPGCLFVALPGENFDGHDFIETAVQKGAKAVLCRKDRRPATSSGEVEFFRVDDTLQAYAALGRAWRLQFSIPVVLVAGSNGKTTTKELLFSALRGKWENVLKTQGSQNGFVGIPMTLLELRSSHQAAVIEVGIDEPGAMIQHVRTVRPTASVLTIVGPEHLEKLIDLETVAREEGIALSAVAAEGGAVAINCDDPWIAPYDGKIQARKLAYTLREEDPSKLHAEISPDLLSFDVSGAGWTRERFQLPLPGRHNATNLLAAIAVARLLGLSAEEMRKGLESFQGAEGRSQLRTFSDGTQVICDYYNSQPASLRAGIELLAQTGQSGKRWACLGDMLELGSNEEAFHREAADWISTLGIENVLLYGTRMKWLESELKKRNFSGILRHFDRQSDLADFLIREAQPGSAVLIKGSRGMKMEEIWKPFEQARK